MKCPHCGGEHPEAARFCPKSGKPIQIEPVEPVCPHCHQPVSPIATYCPHCGKPVRENAEKLPVEKKGGSKFKLFVYIALIAAGVLLIGSGAYILIFSQGQPVTLISAATQTIQVSTVAVTPTAIKAVEPGVPTVPPAAPTLRFTPTFLPSPTLFATATFTITPTVAISPTKGIGSSQVSSKDGMTLLFVPGGYFYMGSDPASDYTASGEETPMHSVYLEAFWVDKTEVTNGMYKKCVETGICRAPKTDVLPEDRPYYRDSRFDDYPVVSISLDDAKTYCKWTGRQLPTEAQWEKAARGTDKRIFPWGNQVDLNNRANYGLDKDTGYPSAVGSYPNGASPYGALDMSGNVFEWVSDFYDAHYYSKSPAQNPTGPVIGDYGIVRGGSWVIKEPGKLKTTYRLANPVTNRDGDDGFRCVMVDN
jgi:formylglycine-generating enzyme required for sulfatase activity